MSLRGWTDERRGTVVRLGLMAALVAGVAGAAGCRLKKPPDAAAIQEEGLPSHTRPAEWAGKVAPGAVEDNWLATFSDEQLSEAVREAILHNADLRVAATRVEQAILHAKQAGAKLWPAADLLARGGGKMSGDNSGLEGVGLTVSWELDLWGRVRYGRAAAAADAAAVQSDFEFARQSLAALVAKSWMLAIEAAQQEGAARAAVRDSDELVRLAESRREVGVGNEEDVSAARANVGTYRDALRQIELARGQAIRALELLLGRYPAAAATIATQLPAQPAGVPGGLPSALLERRPDIVAAERRVAAAFNRVGEAKAARLPAIALTTGVNSISSDLFVLTDRDNPVWSFGANLLVPVFRGGALKRQVEIRSAEQKQSVAAYAAAALRAFGEVENALAAEIAAHEREAILRETLGHSQRALDLVRTQFTVGKTDLRFVTQRQLALNAAQSAIIRVQAEQRVQRVNVHLALGGSFEARQPTGAPAPSR